MRVKSSRRSAWCAACMCRWLNEESRDYDGMGLVSGGWDEGGFRRRGAYHVGVSFFVFSFSSSVFSRIVR